MQQIKQYLKMINPFNNMDEIPVSVYIAKTVLAFLILYFASGVIGEVFIIIGLTVAGYDPIYRSITLLCLLGIIVAICCITG